MGIVSDERMTVERLGNWIIEAEIAHNDMGRLFRARAVDDPTRQAAVKWLTHPKAKTPEFERLFLAQVELLRKLKHPAIVPVLQGGTHEGTPYYVMEWIEGGEFQASLRRGEKPAWTEMLAIGLQIVPALRYAHRRGVLHRDLKPSNLFRGAGGIARLSDFGVTKFFGDALLSNGDNVLGSACFMSPEQAAGKPHTKRSDFYGLGCLFYTLVAGRPPFAGSSVVELIHKHCFVLPERPIHFVPDLPEEIDRFILKLLAKEPAQRPGSGTMLIQEFEGIWSAFERRGLVGKRPAPLAGEDDADIAGEAAVFEPIAPELPPREPISWQKRWYVVGPLFAACVLLLVWGFWGRGPSADQLMARARPLLESDNPADWDRAWTEYLEPLSRKYPDKYREEVEEAHQRVTEKGELQRALAAGKKVHYRSPGERFYYEGLRLLQAGEFAAARGVWENLIQAFDNVEGEKRWVALARDALQRATEPKAADGRFETSLAPVLDRVERLRAEGRMQEAKALAQALEFLYRDDPALEKLRGLVEAR